MLAKLKPSTRFSHFRGIFVSLEYVSHVVSYACMPICKLTSCYLSFLMCIIFTFFVFVLSIGTKCSLLYIPVFPPTSMNLPEFG